MSVGNPTTFCGIRAYRDCMQPCSRRSMLCGAGALLVVSSFAGCLVGGRLRRYRVTNADPVGDLPATVSAEAVATPTMEQPLLIEITFTSTADEPLDFAIDSPGSFPFGTVTVMNLAPQPRTDAVTASGPQRVVLAPRDAGEIRDGCWSATASSASGEDGATERSESLVRLGPGEAVSVRRSVLNDPANAVCYPIGRYRFDETYWVGEDASSRGDSGGIRWGFDLEISDLQPDE